MILADTSVWVDHFQTANSRLQQLLKDLSVLTHPFVIGEIACGNLRQREEIFGALRKFPAASSRAGCGARTLDRRLNEAAGEINLRYW